MIFNSSMVNKTISEIYIALITKKKKKNQCKRPTDYRPVILTTSLCALIAKTLAKRVKKTLLITISDKQLTFVKSRQIIDAILMENEVVDFWKCKSKRVILLTLTLKRFLIK